MNYWLIKSEADCYSIDELKKDKKTSWTGVRNYQARNFMKSMKKGELLLFYHSSAEPTGVVGIAKVVAEAHPDLTALEKKDDHYDPKSTKENPIWFCVDVGFEEKFKRTVSLSEIKIRPDLKGTPVAQKGNRLSVMPISKEHFEIIKKLGESN